MLPASELGVSARRRPHRKSRNGCQQCKLKKIKCDESKPSCGHCKRLQSRCSFLGTSPTASSASEVRTTPSASPQLLDGSDNPLRSLHLSQGASTTNHISLDINNLELLHFYTTTTSSTLSSHLELQQIWQQVVPRIAFTNHFLLHGILALSALHLAHLEPERRAVLHAMASTHHDIGLKTFRIAMSEITPQNSDACLAFSAITAAYAWASSHRTGDLFFSDPPNLEGRSNVEWVSLLRGVYTLLSAAGEWMMSSSMSLIFHPRPIDSELAKVADPEVTSQLAALSHLWESSPEKFSAIELEALEETLAILKNDCELVVSSSEDYPVDIVPIVYGWPIKIPEAFLVMVKELKPEALVVLAHYSVLLNRADQIWFMQGMSRRLLQTIHKKIGKEWESWIAWPLQNLVLTEFKDQGEER